MKVLLLVKKVDNWVSLWWYIWSWKYWTKFLRCAVKWSQWGEESQSRLVHILWQAPNSAIQPLRQFALVSLKIDILPGLQRNSVKSFTCMMKLNTCLSWVASSWALQHHPRYEQAQFNPRWHAYGYVIEFRQMRNFFKRKINTKRLGSSIQNLVLRMTKLNVLMVEIVQYFRRSPNYHWR